MPMTFSITSSAFFHEGDIPDLYTCRGKNISPPFSWSDPPSETKSFALIGEDLDTPVGTVTHWVIYNIPRQKKGLEEAVPHMKTFPDGTVQGKNGMRRNGYMGPCPPWGRHRYYFRLFALDTVLEPGPALTKKKLLRKIEGHRLAEAEILGYYTRKTRA